MRGIRGLRNEGECMNSNDETIVSSDMLKRPQGTSAAEIYTSGSVADCEYCKKLREFSGGPRHRASSRCESGGRPHCTCDVCF